MSTPTKTNTKPFTRVFLRNNYGTHAWVYLRDYLTALPRARKEQQKYRWSREAPTTEEAAELRTKHFTTTLGELVSDAFSDLESLKDEMQEWYDNLPDNFQDGDKGSEIQETIDALENIQEVTLPAGAEALTVMYVPAEEISSRQERCSDAAGRLQIASETIRETLQDLLDAATEEEPFKDPEDWAIIADELETAGQEADGVSFPGMY